MDENVKSLNHCTLDIPGALLEAALYYARLGLKVFPVASDDKDPITKHGFHDATTDLKQIYKWWDAHPTARIGLPMRLNGLICVDVDHYKPGATQRFADLEATHGALPRTCHQRSGNGGEHLVMRDPSPGEDGWTRNHDVGGSCRGGLGSGVDIKNNGYILVEPSGSYQWQALDLANVPDVPAGWIEALQKSEPDSVGSGVEAWETSAGQLNEADKEALCTLLDTLKRGQGQKATFAAVTAIFHDYGQSLQDGEPYLRAWNEECGIPYDDAGLARQVERVSERPQSHARGHMLEARRAAAAATISGLMDAGKPSKPKPTIDGLNERYAWIESLGRVACFAHDTLTYQNPHSFRITHDNHSVIVGGEEGKTIPLGTAWLKSPLRRSYSQVGLWAPPLVEPADSLNLWTGFGVEAKPGTWSLMREHIRTIIADGDPVLDEYIVNWIAWMFQNPGVRPEAVVALRGKEGTGKGALGNALCRILGKHSVHLSDPDDLVGRFSAHLARAIFVFADECYWPGHKALEGRFKRMITESTIKIEGKGVDSYEVDNHLHIFMSTNESWVVPAGPDARRYVVADVSDKRKGDQAYFTALFAELDSGGREAMLFDLLNRNLNGWHPRKIVNSAGLQAQKLLSLSQVDRWLKELLEEGVLPGYLMGNPKAKNRNIATSHDLKEHAYESEPMLRNKGQEVVFEALKSIGCVRWRSRSARGWEFPGLSEARKAWESKVGITQSWVNQADWMPRIRGFGAAGDIGDTPDVTAMPQDSSLDTGTLVEGDTGDTQNDQLPRCGSDA